jgi:hypothetical protein
MGAKLSEADVISTIEFLPIKAADRFIVVSLRSILVTLSKMLAAKSMLLG